MTLKFTLLVSVPPGVVTATLPVVAPLVEHTIEPNFLLRFVQGRG